MSQARKASVSDSKAAGLDHHNSILESCRRAALKPDMHCNLASRNITSLPKVTFPTPFSTYAHEYMCSHTYKLRCSFPYLHPSLPTSIQTDQMVLVSPLLRSLDLSHNQLRRFPPEIFDLESLTTCNVSNNKLRDIEAPIHVGNFVLWRVQSLDVSCNEMTKVPSVVACMPMLVSLDLGGNPIVPGGLAGATALVCLGLGMGTITATQGGLDVAQQTASLSSVKKLELPAHVLGEPLWFEALSLMSGRGAARPCQGAQGSPEEEMAKSHGTSSVIESADAGLKRKANMGEKVNDDEEKLPQAGQSEAADGVSPNDLIRGEAIGSSNRKLEEMDDNQRHEKERENREKEAQQREWACRVQAAKACLVALLSMPLLTSLDREASLALVLAYLPTSLDREMMGCLDREASHHLHHPCNPWRSTSTLALLLLWRSTST